MNPNFYNPFSSLNKNQNNTQSEPIFNVFSVQKENQSNSLKDNKNEFNVFSVQNVNKKNDFNNLLDNNVESNDLTEINK